MTRRRKRGKKNRRQIPGIQWLLYALVFVGTTITWWQSCRTDNTAKADTIGIVDKNALLDVAIPPSQTGTTVRYPGFTVNFNSDKHIPNYVAWELTRNHVDGPYKRTNNFRADESVAGCATPEDYRRSGYDRGHMAPAADMKWSSQAMDACFLLTNICPQSQHLNTGPWRKLEEATRRWAARDSALIVICGPILTDKITETIGTTEVAVPKRFFKVILAPYADPPRGIAFVMSNLVQPGGMQTAATSIDEVERITGMDFFAALPDDIEAQVEEQNNFNQWQRRR